METLSVLVALCAGNSPVPVNSPHKGQWRRALMFSLVCAWINDWVNNREADDLKRHRGHYDVNVMSVKFSQEPTQSSLVYESSEQHGWYAVCWTLDITYAMVTYSLRRVCGGRTATLVPQPYGGLTVFMQTVRRPHVFLHAAGSSQALRFF